MGHENLWLHLGCQPQVAGWVGNINDNIKLLTSIVIVALVIAITE